MIRTLFLSAIAATIIFMGSSCGKDPIRIIKNPTTNETEEAYPDKASGINVSPALPNADGPCTITFTPSSGSDFYGYTGEVYLHTGVIYEDVWMHLPAEWGENTAKCRMIAEGENVWKLSLTPTIREYFDSGDTPVQKLGFVVRNGDGSMQTSPDQFVSVTDEKYAYTPFEPDPIVNEQLPSDMNPGINYNDDGSVTLVLLDKDTKGKSHDYCYLIGDFNGWKRESEYAMKRDEVAGCWWTTLTGLDKRKEYMFQYRIGDEDSDTRIIDPYTEIVYDPWNDGYIPSSTYPDMPSYPSGTKDFVSAFEIGVPEYEWKSGDFSIKDPDNLIIYELLLRDFSESKDLNGAMQHLDYLEDLGINAIELMPVQEFEGNSSWGYNPYAYFALDKAYGTRDMYKKFIDECHSRGIAVIFDVVYNQATGAHPYAKMYWDSKNNKTLPEDPWFNPDAPHQFSVFQDWNHSNPKVREYIKQNLRFLLDEYKVDGFRFDLTKGFTQNSGTESSYDASRVSYLKEYNEAIKAVNPDAVVILEHFVDPENQVLGEAGMKVWRNCNVAYRDALAGRSTSLESLREPYGVPFGTFVGYMESHDEERVCYTGNSEDGSKAVSSVALESKMRRAALNAAFFLTVPGPKMIWQFGELGYDYSIYYNGDRTAEKPTGWDYLEVPARKELHDTYKKLIEFRKDNPEFFTSDAGFRWYVGTGDWDYGRFAFGETNDKTFAVMGNFTSSDKDITILLPSDGTWWNYFDRSESWTGSSATAWLRTGEFKILVNYQ
mgnify:FL=1